MSRRAVLLGALESAPGDLARLCAHVGVEDSHRRAGPGGVSIAESIAHLCELEGCYRAWFEAGVAQDGPHLPPLPALERSDPAPTLAELVEQFRASRAKTLALLRGLPPGAWQRRATLPGEGETTLRWLVQRLVEHDTQSLANIADMRRRLETGG